ncbi:MAG TPA: hypothetical protein VM582_00235 [Candidatus Thermoplasmatota archaeon]|nr:hypothetical protein [Candidatus Thermoplasmatota archaeon]
MSGAGVLAVAAADSAVHVLAERLRHLSYRPRSAWLSFAGGALAYAALHLAARPLEA